MRGRIFWGAAFLLAATAIAQAQQGAASTNGYTAAQRAKAEAAARAAGYTPTLLADVQGGHAFFFATKDGKQYYLTVMPDGTVHAGGVAVAEPPAR